MVPHTKVFIGNLPQGSKPEELRKLFERYGVVTECDIMNRCGFVHMQTEEQASAAIRGLHNTTFNGAALSVERGRYKERGARGGGGGGGRGGRGGPRGGGGGPMRGGPPGGRDGPYGRGGGYMRGGGARDGGYMRGGARDGGYMRGGGARDAPYMRERPMLRELRGPGGAGGLHTPAMMRNGGMGGGGGGGGYERGYEERGYAGYGGEDRRGFLLEARDGYGAAPMYEERPRYDDVYAMEERAPLYPEEREMLAHDRRRAPLPMQAPYDRPQPPMGNGDMYSRRSPMRGGAGGYDRDPYAQQYPPMGRGSGAPPARSGGMGPRRY